LIGKDLTNQDCSQRLNFAEMVEKSEQTVAQKLRRPSMQGPREVTTTRIVHKLK